MSLGPVMLDVVGTELTAEDVRRLQHPLVGGVILFARNFINCEQLKSLTASIHKVRQPPLLIAVDHEGGRVQRFRDGFTKIPPMREFGHIWDANPKKARELAVEAGFVLAAELRAHGVDFSFTPVLDMDYGDSLVIGNRAFHRDPQAINELAFSLMQGLKKVAWRQWVNISLGMALWWPIHTSVFRWMNVSLTRLRKMICSHLGK